MGYQLTKQEVTKEIIKCGKDPAYFIDNYAKISHPMYGLIPFKLYDYQEQLVNEFNDYFLFCFLIQSKQTHTRSFSFIIIFNAL